MKIPPALRSLPDAELAKIFGCSRQAVIFARRRDAGQCVRCASPVDDGGSLCPKHRKKVRNYQRTRSRRNGTRPWKPGKRGRPVTGETA